MKTLSNRTILFIGALAFFMSLAFVVYQSQGVKQSASARAATSTSERAIITLENQFEKDPKNTKAALGLAQAYLQKIRETGDISYYEKIVKILDVAEANTSDNSEILATRAEVANGRHDFKAGLEYIKKAIDKNPDVTAFYGIETDSNIELGNYEEALNSLQKMINKKPNFSSFSRVAYQRELYGDREGAVEALTAAISAGSTHPENVAWAYCEIGKLLVKENPEKAKQDFKLALEIFPNYAPALEGLGRVAFGENKIDEAETYYSQALASLPLAQYATALGNVYQTQGAQAKADQQYVLATLAYKNSKGVNTDLEYSLFLSDHGDSKEALDRAQNAYAARQSIYGADAYAWALFKNNRLPEAQKYITEALRLGEHDSMILFHAGMITEAAGDTGQAKTYFEKASKLDQYASTYYSKVLADKITSL